MPSKLARLARADLKLLKPTYVRSRESARDAIPLRARDGFVRARTLLVNVARSLAKIEGQRLPKTITKSFGERALNELPAALATSMELLLRMIDFLSMAIEEAAEDIKFLLKTKYPEAMKLMQVPGLRPAHRANRKAARTQKLQWQSQERIDLLEKAAFVT